MYLTHLSRYLLTHRNCLHLNTMSTSCCVQNMLLPSAVQVFFLITSSFSVLFSVFTSCVQITDSFSRSSHPSTISRFHMVSSRIYFFLSFTQNISNIQRTYLLCKREKQLTLFRWLPPGDCCLKLQASLFFHQPTTLHNPGE